MKHKRRAGNLGRGGHPTRAKDSPRPGRSEFPVESGGECGSWKGRKLEVSKGIFSQDQAWSDVPLAPRPETGGGGVATCSFSGGHTGGHEKAFSWPPLFFRALGVEGVQAQGEKGPKRRAGVFTGGRPIGGLRGRGAIGPALTSSNLKAPLRAGVLLHQIPADFDRGDSAGPGLFCTGPP